MKRITNLLPVFAFGVMVFGLTALSLTAEEKTYSSTEKRVLQTRPEITFQAIRNGNFQETYETYLSDQFPGRDAWVQLQTDVSRLIGKTESNGVYFGKDQYLLEHYSFTDKRGNAVYESWDQSYEDWKTEMETARETIQERIMNEDYADVGEEE